ncbi:MAG TPA: monovalent cation/H+ antiporter subunit A [Pseudomonadales bacterium]
MLLVALIVLPFVGALLAALLPVNARNAEAWLAGAVALAGALVAAALYPEVAAGEVLHYEAEWLPAAALAFDLRLDGFAWMFALMVTGIGLLVVLYARYYMSPTDPVPRFFSFLLAFMGAMLGIVLSGNLIQLVFFWELTSLVSFLLIGYWHHNGAAREGARIALIVTGSGGLALFAGVLVLGHIVGSYELDRVLASGELIRGHPLYLPALLLVLLGALTKSAQFPFHFWLPQAMAAPTPVSAYLHSATMVKAGVFLLARLWPVMSGTDAWFWIVTSAGAVTLLLGAYVAIFQRDMKGLLAYSTISHLGLITLLLGLSTPLSAVAAIFHIMNHATFKASLFMAAGIADHETGTRDLRRLHGLWRFMPITSSLAMVASAAMGGVPLLNGFLSKEMFFSQALHASGPENQSLTLLPLIATVWGVFSVAYSLRLIHGVPFGPPPDDLPRTPNEPPHWMRFPIEVLVLACLLVGTLPKATIGPVLAIAVGSALGADTPEYNLMVWHGFTLPLLMSVLAMVGGSVLYLLLRRRLTHGAEGAPVLRHLNGPRLFNALLVALSWRIARPLENRIGSGRLQSQLAWLVLVALGAALLPLWAARLPEAGAGSAMDPALALVWVGGLACAVAAAQQARYHRLAALILMGGAGIAVCVTFAWFSAPDLALTQLVVEIVTTILLLLGLRWLPKHPRERAVPAIDRLRRMRDLAFAAAAGGGVAALAYTAMSRPVPDSIAGFFLERAYSEGGGNNVVNVILVDFRGFDTFGEITVLGVVALAVYALLRRFRPAPESLAVPAQQQIQRDFDAANPGRTDIIGRFLHIPSVIMRLLFPVTTLVALYLLLRGHNQPGGGFIAGITLAAAMIVQYMAGGTRWVEERLRFRITLWVGAGLMLAAVTGIGAWLFQHPFLTSHTRYLAVPVLGELPFASALFFDVGVFLLVFGATVLMLVALAHQSLRAGRTLQHEAEAQSEHAPVPARKGA